MESSALFYILLFLVGSIAVRIGLYRLFQKAGEQSWAAFVPVYSDLVWIRMIGKPTYYIVFTLIPIARTLVKISMNIEMAKAFGKYKFGEQAMSVLLPFVFFPKIGFEKDAEYLGPPDEHKKIPAKGAIREWADAFLFAGVAALIIRTFFIEAFMIPTSSMERTLLAGDFLFVSKFHYGPRMPMIPMSIPFVHNKIKLGGMTMPSYLDWIELPYWRAPGLNNIKRNDIVVFNYPAHDIHDLGDGTVQKVSMKENYIKRCVALPGDKLQIKAGQIYINDAIGWNPEHMQYSYRVNTRGPLTSQKRLQKMGFRYPFERTGNGSLIKDPYGQPIIVNNANYFQNADATVYTMWMSGAIAQTIGGFPNSVSVDTLLQAPGVPDENIYPKDIKNFPFNRDNFGPIALPKAGETVQLTPENYKLYERPITAYEGHTLEKKGSDFYIDGQKSNSYTFEMNYYFMMGDNRHNSEDSRFWGFVPENHIVGRPLFVFLSFESEFGIRWNRIGTKYIH